MLCGAQPECEAQHVWVDANMYMFAPTSAHEQEHCADQRDLRCSSLPSGGCHNERM